MDKEKVREWTQRIVREMGEAGVTNEECIQVCADALKGAVLGIVHKRPQLYTEGDAAIYLSKLIVQIDVEADAIRKRKQASKNGGC